MYRLILSFTVLSFTVLTFMLAAPAVEAAPTCQNKTGITFRCGTPGAMPVGWTPSPQQMLDRAVPAGPGANAVLKVICGIALFLAMIALMPEFDGSRAEDWDRQEDDDDSRR